ncbi:unnamed protein product, partial [Mesorhabditis belari]|uniref:Uncharacterized protein n=1 Tax=Mesorhabditis belari TaxID=2138241 RepID=A0AAF3EMT2_9BILA
MKTILLVLALIQVTVALRCVDALKDSPQLDGSERSKTCLCGDYCVSYYYQSENKYAWDCGCLMIDFAESLNLCGHEGINIFGDVRPHCCMKINLFKVFKQKMKTILVVFALIQVSVTLECVHAAKNSTQLDGSERSYTCLCGDFCLSYYYPVKKLLARGHERRWGCILSTPDLLLQG